MGFKVNHTSKCPGFKKAKTKKQVTKQVSRLDENSVRETVRKTAFSASAVSGSRRPESV